MRAGVVVVVGLACAACGRLSFDGHTDASGVQGDTASADAAPAFTDSFDRADSSSLGNAWAEKTSGTYQIASQQVARTNFAKDYRDSIVVRPQAEDLLDVEVAVEFTVGHVPPGYPQIHARVQRSTLGTPNTLDGYLLYIDGLAGNGVMTAKVTRQHGTVLPPPLTTFTLSPELVLGGTYRLRLAVRGTSPVMLDGIIEQRNGGTWSAIGSVSTIDTDVTAVTTAGAVGFDVGQPEAAGYYTYDHFAYTPL